MIELVSVRPTLEFICHHAANIMQIPAETIRSKRRNHSVIKARFLVAYVARGFKYTFMQIAEFLNRDYSTVIYEVKSYKTLTELYDYFGNTYDRLIKALEIKRETSNLFSY